jgi:hypothetical protein
LPRSLAQQLEPNVLVIKVQPDEGITLRIGAKIPGQTTRIRWVNMDFRYGSSFGFASPEAYERLLHDCMLGDSTPYARRDMTERGWEMSLHCSKPGSSLTLDFPIMKPGAGDPRQPIVLSSETADIGEDPEPSTFKVIDEGYRVNHWKITGMALQAIDVDAIERQLTELWKDAAAHDSEAGVIRACVLNLLVYVPSGPAEHGGG